jgi:flagellar hook assembly protein FlgD
VQRGYISEDLSGSFLRLWDGRATDGKLVPPGMYLYQVQVESDDGTHARQGVVSVVY